MKCPLRIVVAAVMLSLGLAASSVSAQNMGAMAPAPASSSMGPMRHGMMHHKMMMRPGMNGSMHRMAATVKSVDAKTGIVEVEAGGMALTVHFPPASVADLKKGDKITLHMGYTR